MESISEKAIAILDGTNDGNSLSPSDLKLVENAVNGLLNERGQDAFLSLYDGIQEKGYSPNFLHGIENITVDHDGFIKWKGIVIEHYDDPYSNQSKDCLLKISDRCNHIESLGIEVFGHNVIWFWDWFKDIKSDSEWLPLICKIPSAWESDSGLALCLRNGEIYYFDREGNFNHLKDENELYSLLNINPNESSHYHRMKQAGFHIAKAGQPENAGFMYAPIDGVISLFERYYIQPLEIIKG